jgi:xanthine dehydrogenase accessory factor
MNDLLDLAHALRAAGQPFALATVVRAEKPTSAKAGARALITADGRLTGWIGGNCAEPAVIRESLRSLQAGEPLLLRLCPPDRLSGQDAPGVRELALTCVSGGTLEIYIEPHLAQPQLVVVSHLPIASALASLGEALGYAVTVVGLDAAPERFPQARRVVAHLDFAQVDLRRQTFVVVASHGNYDEEALAWALGTPAAYVALVASPRRAEAVRQYLRETGVDAAALARLKCPAGLDLGAVTPEETALSILAETVQFRRQGAPAPAAPKHHHHDPAEHGRPSDHEARPAHGERSEHSHRRHEPAAEHRHAPDRIPLPVSEIAIPATALDPVCGMEVTIAGARHVSQYQGQTYYFCCPGCQRSFEKEPEKYLGS